MQRMWGSKNLKVSAKSILTRQSKRYITLLFVLILLGSFVFLGKLMLIEPIYGSEQFNDIKSSDWFYGNVSDLVKDSRQIIKGYPDGSFKPLTKLTKDQFITMIVRAAGFNLPNATGYWAQNNIDKALELGFIKTGEFGSYTGEITREEMSFIIVRVVENLYGPQSFSALEEVLQVVKDSEDFTYKYKESIMKTYKLGIITGYPDFTFKPQGVLTRSEASAVIIRVIKPEKRIAFDFDAIYNKLYGDFESHFLGGENWVDPIAVTNRESAQEDWALITSDMSYSPSENAFNLNLANSFYGLDEALGTIQYNSEGALAGQLDDFERLLLRRLPLKDVDKVMNYLNKKTSYTTFLDHKETFFYLYNDTYLIWLNESILYGWDPVKKKSVTISFAIFSRDEIFVEKYEEYLLFHNSDEDVFIFK